MFNAGGGLDDQPQPAPLAEVAYGPPALQSPSLDRAGVLSTPGMRSPFSRSAPRTGQPWEGRSTRYSSPPPVVDDPAFLAKATLVAGYEHLPAHALAMTLAPPLAALTQPSPATATGMTSTLSPHSPLFVCSAPATKATCSIEPTSTHADTAGPSAARGGSDDRCTQLEVAGPQQWPSPSRQASNTAGILSGTSSPPATTATAGEEVPTSLISEHTQDQRLHHNLTTLTHDARARASVVRTLTQMREWYADRGPRPPVDPGQLSVLDDAESLKTALINNAPWNEVDLQLQLTELPDLWSRVALHRLRLDGERQEYLVVRSVDGEHRHLILQVPAEGLTVAERRALASQQMTYHDDLYGRFEPGLRLKDSFLDLTEPGEETFKEGYQRGFPMHFIHKPRPVRRRNYDSYDVEHADKSSADLTRQLHAGFIEGPLLYAPWVINAQGGVYQEDKNKYRPILDCADSGLNELLIPLHCEYDLLEDTLKDLRPGDHLSGFDWKDAFYLWPRLQEHCDYLGLRGPDGKYYRYRFTPMGLMDSPAIQSIGARILKRAINANLSKVCLKQNVAGAHDSKVLGVFVDDGQIRHDKLYSTQQKLEQFQAYVDTMDEYHKAGTGPIDSEHKRSLPAPTGVHIGNLIDPQRMYVSVTPDRRRKYQDLVTDFTTSIQGNVSVNRKTWASITGKLQYTAPLVRGMQAQLSDSYSVLKNPVSGDYKDWRRHARSHCSAEQIESLQRAGDLLGDAEGCQRRIYHDNDTGCTTFWKGEIADTHEYLDQTSLTAKGIQVFTGDADKGAAGLWHHHLRHVHLFPPAEQPPLRSSNYRELKTAVIGVDLWGHLWPHQRVLYRSDNTVTVGIINSGGTTAATLIPLAQELATSLRLHDIDLAAVHIPGVENGLADRLSRHRRRVDTGDWLLRRRFFDAIHEHLRRHWLHGQVLTLDGSADVVGNNSQLTRYCSEVDSIFERDLRGEHLWCNGDFTLLELILRHFLLAYHSDPLHTSGTFLLPEWTDQAFWKHTKGARVIARFPTGTRAFTSPDWLALGGTDGQPLSYGPARAHRGNTRWPFVVIHFPYALGGRRAAGGPGAPDPVVADGQRRPRVPTLRGERHHDSQLLRGLPPGLVS